MVEDMFESIRQMEKGCHGFNSPPMTKLLDELEDELIQHFDTEKADSFEEGYHRGQMDTRRTHGY